MQTCENCTYIFGIRKKHSNFTVCRKRNYHLLQMQHNYNIQLVIGTLIEIFEVKYFTDFMQSTYTTLGSDHGTNVWGVYR